MNCFLNHLLATMLVVGVICIKADDQSQANQPTDTQTTVSTHLEKSIDAVVSIETEHNVVIKHHMQHGHQAQVPEFERKYGSGFFISDTGLLVTNAHVVQDAKNIVIRNQNGNEALGFTLGIDPLLDIAVIQTNMRANNYIKLDHVVDAKIGEPVYAIGTAFGLPQSVSYGIVSALHRSISNPLQDFIQTDSAINQGNSGGPLINKQGQLIGVNTMIIGVKGGNNGVGFAIPTMIVRNIVEQITQYGDIKPSQVGIHIQNISADMAIALGSPNTQGVVVTEIADNSTASQLGLKTKDIITQINQQKITSSAQIAALVYSMRAGSEITVKGIRDSKPITLTAKLSSGKDQGNTTQGIFQGLTLTEFNGMNTSGKLIMGVGVIEVETGSPGWLAGLLPNDLIIQIGNTKILTLADLQTIKPTKPVLIEIIRQNKPALLVLTPTPKP